MILYYAVGGGWGHFSRGMAVAHTLQIPLNKIVFLTSAVHIPAPDGYRVIEIPKELPFKKDPFVKFLNQLLEDIKPETLLLDTFPLGIMKELPELNWSGQTKVVARRMRWSVYNCDIGTDKIVSAYVVEELEPPQLVWFNQNQVPLEKVNLVYPEMDNQSKIDLPLSKTKKNLLIAHSGSSEELNVLIEKAKTRFPDAHIVLGCEKKVGKDFQQFDHIHVFPIYPFTDAFDYVVTAGGFNLLHQLKPVKAKHWVVPLDRRYDDQFLRVRNLGLKVLE
jgi:hypothetical protein